MAIEDTPRGRLPARVLEAKRAAVSQLLRAVAPRPTFAAFAASARPEHNVVGIGVGYKVANGTPTQEVAVRIYVARKLTKEAVPQDLLLPERIEGVATDVVETGRFRALPASVPMVRRRLRPARPGCSVGFQFSGAMAGLVMAGTFGAVVEGSGARYILSNNHVLANENALPTGSPIFQPGLLDGGNPATDQIARLTRFVPITPGAPNSVDCAIAEALQPQSVRATLLPRVGRLHSPDPIDAVVDMPVMKVGRTTGFTVGTVFDISADVNVDYDLGTVTFQDQILVEGGTKPFSDSGDSGSLIVDRTTRRGTGLLFAGSQTHTIGNHLSDVLAALNVALVI